MKKLSVALIGLSLVSPFVFADQVFDVGDVAKVSIFGFAKEEYAVGTNRSSGLTNCTYPTDPRGVFAGHPPGGGANPAQCQPGQSGFGQTDGPGPFNLWQLGADISHEFDNAWKISARASYRMRDGQADIPGPGYSGGYFGHIGVGPNYGWLDMNVAVTHPEYGEVRYGSFATRSWSRSDSFSYPIGLSSQWSETGSGYGAVQNAARYTSKTFEVGGGKLVLEGTFAAAQVHIAPNAAMNPNVDQTPPKPSLGELFAQYSNNGMLVEYIFQTSTGGQQSSFAKGGFLGDYGNADNNPNYLIPAQNVNIIQGNYYFTPKWLLTFGGRRNFWSGSAAQCDYMNPLPGGSTGGCYAQYGGFNNNGVSAINSGTSAYSYDFMLGGSYIDGLYTYTLGGVRLNKAYTQNPVQYGQNNGATYLNLGIYRKVPEVYKNLSVYGGLGYVMFDRLGPAPLSMPSELSFGGVDPRSNRSGASLTMGINIVL